MGEGRVPPDGNMDAAVLILINTSATALSVICNKCRRCVWRERGNHYRPRGHSDCGTSTAPSAQPANWQRWGLIKPGFSETFDRFAVGKSLFACQFKKPLKELILILIGTSSLFSQCGARIRNELRPGRCVRRCRYTCWCVCLHSHRRRGKTVQVKLTANTSDRPTNEGSAHTFSLQDPDLHLTSPPLPTCTPNPHSLPLHPYTSHLTQSLSGTSSSASDKLESELQSSQLGCECAEKRKKKREKRKSKTSCIHLGCLSAEPSSISGCSQVSGSWRRPHIFIRFRSSSRTRKKNQKIKMKRKNKTK